MNILVTGATGVLGRRAVARLVAAGHTVTGVARTPERTAAVAATGAEPRVVDLFDPDDVRRAVAGHDAVAHLATRIPPMTRSGSPKAWQENSRLRSVASRHLVDAALAAGVDRYVQESIAFLYADHGDEWIVEALPLAASAVTPPVVAAEAQARRITEAGGAGVVLRFGVFHGPDSVHSIEQLRAAHRGWSLLLGDPGTYAPAITTDDAATAVVAALGAPAGTWNVVDDRPLTRLEEAEALAAAVGRARLRPLPGLVHRYLRRKAPMFYRSQRVGNEPFRTATGWAPATSSAREAWAAIADEHRELAA